MPVLLLSTTCDLKMWQNVQAYAPRICLRRSHSKTCQSCRGWTFSDRVPARLCHTLPSGAYIVWNAMPWSTWLGTHCITDFNWFQHHLWCRCLPFSEYHPIFLCPSAAKACVATLITRPRQLPGPYQTRLAGLATPWRHALRGESGRHEVHRPMFGLFFCSTDSTAVPALRFWIRLSAFGRGT